MNSPMMNQIINKVGTYNFSAEPFHCDFSDRIMPGHLGNQMLNASDYHSDERGYGIRYLNTINKTWVLSRLCIEMEQFPKAYTQYTISTWVDKVMHSFTTRNFDVLSSDGTPLGYGRSIWALIDTETRQPFEIAKVNNGVIQQYVETTRPCPIAEPDRVRITQPTTLAQQLKACYSDVDINGHVNSIKYVEHALDLFDLSWYRQHQLKRIDIAYVAESHEGDQLNFYKAGLGNEEFAIKVVRFDKTAQTEKECVRIKVKFVKE